jgi:hypothetical protein
LGGSGGAGGLNSGETRKYDEAALWQNAVGPRLRTFRETLQFGLLDRFAALGKPVELELEEPEFDDEAPAYALAAQSLRRRRCTTDHVAVGPGRVLAAQRHLGGVARRSGEQQVDE